MFPQTLTFILALAATMANAAPNPIVAERVAGSKTSPELAKRTDHSGEGTVYLQQGGIGSCGQANPDSSFIGALSNYWQQNESPGPYCGRQIQISNTGSNDGVGGKGNSVTITVADTCPSCDENHIDLSVGAWNALTNNAPYGTVDITWHFL